MPHELLPAEGREVPATQYWMHTGTMTEIEKDAARYRWLVRHEYISSELWNDFVGNDANTGIDPSAIIDYQMRLEDEQVGDWQTR